MLVMLQIVAPLLAFAFSSVTLNYLGRARKRQWLLALVQKPSKGLLLILHQRLFCCDGYLWESLFLGLLFSFVTTRVLSKQHTMMCFMSEQNISKQPDSLRALRSPSLSTGFNAIHFLRASDRGSSYEVPHHCAIPILSIQTPHVIP